MNHPSFALYLVFTFDFIFTNRHTHARVCLWASYHNVCIEILSFFVWLQFYGATAHLRGVPKSLYVQFNIFKLVATSRWYANFLSYLLNSSVCLSLNLKLYTVSHAFNGFWCISHWITICIWSLWWVDTSDCFFVLIYYYSYYRCPMP